MEKEEAASAGRGGGGGGGGGRPLRPLRGGLGLRISLRERAGPALISPLDVVERVKPLREAELDRVRLELRLRCPLADADGAARCSVRSSLALHAGMAGEASICASEMRPLRLLAPVLPWLEANATAMELAGMWLQISPNARHQVSTAMTADRKLEWAADSEDHCASAISSRQEAHPTAASADTPERLHGVHTWT